MKLLVKEFSYLFFDKLRSMSLSREPILSSRDNNLFPLKSRLSKLFIYPKLDGNASKRFIDISSSSSYRDENYIGKNDISFFFKRNLFKVLSFPIPFGISLILLN